MRRLPPAPLLVLAVAAPAAASGSVWGVRAGVRHIWTTAYVFGGHDVWLTVPAHGTAAHKGTRP